MLDTTLAYSSYNWAMNGFSSDKTPTAFASSSKFTTDEQIKLVWTSLGVSVGVGLTDFLVRFIRRMSEEKKQKIFNSRDITIVPLEEDPDAIPIKRNNE